jgi:hypothetical protein
MCLLLEAFDHDPKNTKRIQKNSTIRARFFVCSEEGRRPLDSFIQKGIIVLLLFFLLLSTPTMRPILKTFDHDPKEHKMNHGGHQQTHQGNGHVLARSQIDPDQVTSRLEPKHKVDSHDKQ